MTPTPYPTLPKDRFDVYRFFNGLAVDAQEGILPPRSRVPLVKSFLLEHVSSRGNRLVRTPEDIFRALGAEVRLLDDTFAEIRCIEDPPDATASGPRVVGYLEKYDERFFAYYTSDRSELAQRRVRHWIADSADLDSTWFGSQVLQRLWDNDVSRRGDERFGKLTFRHQSIFEMPADADEDGEAQDSDDSVSDGNDDRFEFERRKAAFNMADRIGRIRDSLEKLQSCYSPLHALYGLRFPSRGGLGSHDLYQEGRVTNRSDSFEEHRNLVRYLYRTYRTMLDLTEDVAWHDVEASAFGGSARSIRGVPLVVRFNEHLSPSTFKRWVALALRKGNRFRLWGDPIWMGPTKVHVYGADRHLWQPINIEMTDSSLIAILPQGTCGNTFHRLVTNVQAYVCPELTAWLGASDFKTVIDRSISQSEGGSDEC